ncbi:MAG: PilC/PilY family type IV pilus protein, partial [Cellvibrionales bacterium]|nr:PilC/PilY family type IV pilus protein [Cellvibrionales bacterium]
GEMRNDTNVGLRNRDSVLGDIVRSSPTFVGHVPEGVSGKDAIKGPKKLDFNAVHPNLTSWWNLSMDDLMPQEYKSPFRRDDVVYVNANDGMLHAFRHSKPTQDGEGRDIDGKEIFAYMPSYIASSEEKAGLHYLTDPNYQHRFMNDGTAWVKEDVYLHKKSDWRTLLISVPGAGGRGISLLDVTDIHNGSVDEAKGSQLDEIVLWEFTHPELGITLVEPYIGLMRNGMWGVIVGNGYDSQSGQAKVFIINVEPNLNDGWTQDEDYFIIDADIALEDEYGANGMSTVVAADVFEDTELCAPSREGLNHVFPDPCVTAEGTNGDVMIGHYYWPGYGTVDRLYGGDLYGNMWALNVMSTDPSQWTVDFDQKPLFTVPRDEDGLPQPITAPPRLAWAFPISRCDAPDQDEYITTYRQSRYGDRLKLDTGGYFGDQNVQPFEDWDFEGVSIIADGVGNAEGDEKLHQRDLTCGPNVMVTFGTGQFITKEDVTDTKKRAFYGVWDNHKSNHYPLTLSDLEQRVFITAGTGEELTRRIRDVDGFNPDVENVFSQYDEATDFGWYVNFDQPGERVTYSPLLNRRTNEVVFASIIPEDEACGVEGYTIVHRLDTFSGLPTQDKRVDESIHKDGVIAQGFKGLSYGMSDIGKDGVTGDEFFAVATKDGYIGQRSIRGTPPPRGIVAWYELEQ